MTGLGDLEGGIFDSAARGISADGSVVVGRGISGLGDEAFIWDAHNGMRSLQDLLVVEFGLDLTGWRLTVAYDVSADGRTIVGVGINPSGYQEAWIARIPEPATFGLFTLGVMPMIGRRQGRG